MYISKHKVFISYYHKDDQCYKNQLINMCEVNPETLECQSLFDDYSVHENEIDDTGLTSEQIRRIIRDEYIKDATVLILLCGQNTKKRKHIDWEIHAAMYNSEKNPQMGILVINLPTINQSIHSSTEEEKPLLSDNEQWFSIKTKQEYEKNFPYMPSRIIDNFVKEVPITVVDWNRVCNNTQILKQLIDNAYRRRSEVTYDHSTPLRRQNS